MSLHSPDLLDRLSLPIINAPMAGAAGGALAHAVSRAGGLGLVGVGHGASNDFIDRELPLVAESADLVVPPDDTQGAPLWGAGLMSWSLDLDDSALTRVLDHGAPVIALAAGDPSEHARRAHAAGAFVMVQVGTTAEILAAASNPDIAAITVRGSEAGGHGLNEVSTLALLQFALQHTHQPVIAAGGIGTAAGLAGVIGAGAVAGWIGTRLIPTDESLAPTAHKQAVLDAGLEDTVYTSVFDIALDIPWPHEYGGRTLTNDVTALWSGPSEQTLRDAVTHRDPEAQDLSARVRSAKAAGDPSASPLYAGQSAGLVDSAEGSEQSVPDGVFPAAADVLAELGGFRSILAGAARRWGI
jgi:nitronate monooxygenase